MLCALHRAAPAHSPPNAAVTPSRLGERDRRTRAPACSNQVRPVEGRPFTSAHADLLADAAWMHPAPHVHAMRGWARDCAAAREQADNATEYGVLGELWLTHAQHEHASVASFSRYSLELLKYARRAHRRGRVGPRMGRAIGSARRHTCFWRRTQRRPTKCATRSQVFAVANRRRGFRLVHTECCGRTPSASVGAFTYGGDGCWGMRAVLQGYEMQWLLALGGAARS